MIKRIINYLIAKPWMRKKGVFFVQIGGEKGLDFVQRRTEKYGWTGLIVEAHPENFKELKHNYRETKDIAFENVAIAEKKGTMKLYSFGETSNLHSLNSLEWYKGYREGKAYKNRKELGQKKPLTVKTITLKELFKKHEITELNYFQTDTEGYDYEIIMQLMHDTCVRPECIQYESHFITGKKKLDILFLLAEKGYNYRIIGSNTYAWRTK